MKYNPDKHHRRSIRLPGYDYSRIGLYFITLCTHNRQCMFGEITDGVMILNDTGRVAEKCWNEIPLHFPHVELDEWVIMPNHVHGIVSITMDVDCGGVDGGGGGGVGAKNLSPLHAHDAHAHDAHAHDAHARGDNDHRCQDHHQPCGTSKTIGSIVRGFKIGITKWIRQNRTVHDVWLRNYWEHIIRNENELKRIRMYIRNNPKNWQDDKLNDDGGGVIREETAQYANEEWMI